MNTTVTKKRWLKLLIPISIIILFHIASLFPLFIEKYYYGILYPVISVTLRFIFGWLPFSIGDILYASALLWLIIKAFKNIQAIVKKRVSRQSFFRSLYRSIAIILWVYIFFYGLWGLNYSRLGIAYQLQLQPGKYTVEDLKQLTGSLITKVNNSRKQLGDNMASYPSNAEMFGKAEQSYKEAERKYPFLHYRVGSVKSSVWGWLGNYTGFLGYYNPFSGEAQVNTIVPAFVLPFTTCHEIGHQLGYGSEDEANFAGYLSATSSQDERFHYSAYFDLFAYSNAALFERDSIAARANYKMLDTLVKKDIKTYRKFIAAHKNPIEPYITMLYSKYLQANNQPKGIDTYDEVVAWLIAYRKKYGEL